MISLTIMISVANIETATRGIRRCFERFHSSTLGHPLLAFTLFLVVRFVVIANTDNSLQGDAVSRLNNIFHMSRSFKHWPVDIWLPFPFWLQYLGTVWVDEWIVWPRVLNVLLVGTLIFPLFSLLRAYFSRAVAVAAVYVVALSFPHAIIDTLPLSEPIFIALCVWLVHFLRRYRGHRRLLDAGTVGALSAALVLTRYEALVLNFFLFLYVVLDARPSLKHFVAVFILPLAALAYVFRMNVIFGGHVLWGITNSDLIVANYHKLGTFEGLGQLHTSLRAFPLPAASIYLGFTGLLLRAGKTLRERRPPVLEAYVALITLLLFYKLATLTLIADYRYFNFSSLALTIYALYAVHVALRRPVLQGAALAGIVLWLAWLQPQKVQEIGGPYRYHEGLKAAASWMRENFKPSYRVMIDRERDGVYKWHTEAWGVLSGFVHGEGYHCVVTDFPNDPRYGGFDLVRARGCMDHHKINVIVAFNNGFLAQALRDDHPLLRDYDRTPLFEADGYAVFAKKD